MDLEKDENPPDNRKSLIFKAFPVCPYYTIRAYLCNSFLLHFRLQQPVFSDILGNLLGILHNIQD